MMSIGDVLDYCLKKYGVYEDYPFGPDCICCRIRAGSKTPIFAQLMPNWNKITLRSSPERSFFYREEYKDSVVRGYHCPPVQQPYLIQ